VVGELREVVVELGAVPHSDTLPEVGECHRLVGREPQLLEYLDARLVAEQCERLGRRKAVLQTAALAVEAGAVDGCVGAAHTRRYNELTDKRSHKRIFVSQ